MSISTCYTAEQITAIGGSIISNDDGSISVYVPGTTTTDLVPLSLTKPCCEQLGLGYVFDIDSQKCVWSRFHVTTEGCSLASKFNIVLNPKGNDGSIFYVDTNETCILSIDFDYLFNIKCDTILNILFPTLETAACDSVLQAFESLDVSMTVDVVSGTTNVSVYENNFFPAIGDGNLYTYISNNSGMTGFYVCGQLLDTSIDTNCHGLTIGDDADLDCGSVGDGLINSLWEESSLSGNPSGMTIFNLNIHPDSFNSEWLHFHVDVTDQSIIDQIINQKIKISLKINHTCADFCVLLDNIVLDKNCTAIETSNIYVTKSPGFELDRIRDNKKSWIFNTNTNHRQFNITKEDDSYPIRLTDYIVNDERLIINTKEIDLDISLASAIETDVWRYIVDNSCLLSGCSTGDTCCTTLNGCSTGTTCCGDNKLDFTSLMTQPLSSVTTVEDFEYFITSELIDVKDRQTLSGYPTLRALYDRYMTSNLYCSNNSSMFDYLTMDQFAGLVGNYWVDIVEQVIPATTIWGSTKIYSNTIFDQQKYKYKAYSLQLCGNPFSGDTVLSPVSLTGDCAEVNVSFTSIAAQTNPLQTILTSLCSNVCIAQMNSGSEFIGTITIVGPDSKSMISGGPISLFAG